MCTKLMINDGPIANVFHPDSLQREGVPDNSVSVFSNYDMNTASVATALIMSMGSPCGSSLIW